jgi:hypothetical protein
MPLANSPATGGHRYRHRQSRAALAATLLGVSLAVGTTIGAATEAGASSKGSSGTLVLKGFLSGTLKVPAFLPPGQVLTGCQISPSQAGTVVLQWDKAKLDVNGRPKTLSNIDLQVDVQSFGHSYSMNLNSYGESLGGVTFQSNMSFGWTSVSGTLTTTKSGTSGSVSGTMGAGKQHPGTVTIKGNWAGCSKLS